MKFAPRFTLFVLVTVFSAMVSGCSGEASPRGSTSHEQEAKPDVESACSSFQERIRPIAEISRDELLLLMAEVFAGVDAESVEACMRGIDQDFELTCPDVCTIKPRN